MKTQENKTKNSQENKFEFKYYLEEQQATVFWLLVFLILLGFIFLQPIIIGNKVYNHREKVVVLDQAGSFHVGKLKEPNELKEMVDYLAKQCTKAFFERDSSGLTHHRLASQCFRPAMLSKIMTRMEKENDRFREKQSIQKVIKINPEIKYWARTRNSFDLSVYGEIRRTDFFEGQKIYTRTPFTLSLYLERNPGTGKNDFMPLAVSNYKLELEKGIVE